MRRKEKQKGRKGRGEEARCREGREGRTGRTRKETSFEFKLKFGFGGWSSSRNGKC